MFFDRPADRLRFDMRLGFPRVQLLIAAFVIVLVIGCSGSPAEPDPDALVLRNMAGMALIASGIEGAVLRQISVNPATGSLGFAVTDKDATVGVELWADTPGQPPNEWRKSTLEFIRYKADVSLDIDSVIQGATSAMGAATDHWPGCVPRGQTVVESAEGNTWWYVFCDLPEGTVSGLVDAETGEFTPSGAPPAVAPVTATPGA